MKVLTIETILNIRKEIDFTNNSILVEILNNYLVSNKVNKIAKKKNLLNKINFDIIYQNFEVSKFDNKFKSILIAFNKLSKDNILQVIDNLKKVLIDDYNLLEKVSDFLCKKSINETNFVNLYIKLIEELSVCPKWIVKYNEVYLITIKEAIILHLQYFFENQLDNSDKELCNSYFKFLSKIYNRNWITQEIYDVIIQLLFEKEYYEYIITFLKGCTFNNLKEIKELLLQKKLPMRLKFLLEEV